MNQKHALLFAVGAVSILFFAWSTVSAGDMKAEEVGNPALYRSHFGQTPFPNKSIAIDANGVHFFLSPETEKPEYTALYSFFKLGGDFEVSVNYDWTPVIIPKGGYGVSCGVAIETNDKKKSIALARGNFPGQGSAYRVTTGTWREDKKVDYKSEPPFETTAKSGRLIILRKKKEVICLAADEEGEPKELCKIPFTDAAVQRVLIFADPGATPTELDAWFTRFKIRADEMSHHMVKQEQSNPWWGVYAGLVLIVVGTMGYFVVRRIRTGRWRGGAEQ
ncbi:MAG TPA: hypothetical protein VFE62_15080 [Gemmataceae bacterium]|nr:hypothetical protein [Gemmataceae bacterium]